MRPRKILNLLEGWGWQYVMRLKSNRKFGEHSLRTTWPHRYGHARGELRGVDHPVLVVKDGRRYWGTNDLTLTVREVKAPLFPSATDRRDVSVAQARVWLGGAVSAKNTKPNGRIYT